jgi:metallophosphoesterase superfamily enzyme
VAADVHVGLARQEGHTGELKAGSPVSLAEAILEGVRITRSRRVLLLGDVKEPILGAPWHVRGEVKEFFASLLGAGVVVEVCQGNHDVGLARMAPQEVIFHPSGGVAFGPTGLFHGHAWPSVDILKRSSIFAAGHLHPGIRLAAEKVRCWVRVRYPEKGALGSRTGKPPVGIPGPRATEAIVIPALNPLCACESLNQNMPRRGRSFLVRRFLLPGEARAYLLDGTDVGRLALSP